MWSADQNTAGRVPIQHHEAVYSGRQLEVRLCKQYYRVLRRFQDNRQEIDTESPGDVLDGSLWPRDTRISGGWMHSWPVEINEKPPRNPVVSKGLGVTITQSPFTRNKPAAPTAESAPRRDGLEGRRTVALARGARTGVICGDSLDPQTMLPLKNDKWKTDETFDGLRANMPDDWPLFPRGFRGIMLNATDHLSQQNLFMPIDPRIIAVNRAGDPRAGSLVCDLDGKSRIDPDYQARVQTFWRVVRPRPASPCFKFDPKLNTIAWNLAPTGCEKIPGLGLVFDRPIVVAPPSTAERSSPFVASRPAGDGLAGRRTVALPRDASFGTGGHGSHVGVGLRPSLAGRETRALPRGRDPFRPTVVQGAAKKGVIAISTAHLSGPFAVGDDTDQHRITKTADGEVINSLHWSTLTYWLGHGGDAPLEFQKIPYVEPPEAPFTRRVHLRHDPSRKHPFCDETRDGLWRWLAESFFYPPCIPPPSEGFPPDVTTPSNGVPLRDIPTWGTRDISDGLDYYAASTTSTAFSGFLVRPVDHSRIERVDIRRTPFVEPDDILGFDRIAPMTLRMEGFTLQTAAGNPIYTQKPNDARYCGGTACGGLVVLPPELDVADRATNYTRNDQPLSRSGIVFAPGTWVGVGLPDNVSGGIIDGHFWERDATNPKVSTFRTAEGKTGTVNACLDDCFFTPAISYPSMPMGDKKKIPTAFNSDFGGNVNLPVTDSLGFFGTERYPKNQRRGFNRDIPIPEKLCDEFSIVVDIEFQLEDDLDTEEILFRAVAAIIPRQGSTTTATTISADQDIDGTSTGDLVIVKEKLGRVLFEIPATSLAGKEGGKVSFSFARLGDLDNYAGNVHVTDDRFAFYGACISGVILTEPLP